MDGERGREKSPCLGALTHYSLYLYICMYNVFEKNSGGLIATPWTQLPTWVAGGGNAKKWDLCHLE